MKRRVSQNFLLFHSADGITCGFIYSHPAEGWVVVSFVWMNIAILLFAWLSQKEKCFHTEMSYALHAWKGFDFCESYRYLYSEATSFLSYQSLPKTLHILSHKLEYTTGLTLWVEPRIFRIWHNAGKIKIATNGLRICFPAIFRKLEISLEVLLVLWSLLLRESHKCMCVFHSLCILLSRLWEIRRAVVFCCWHTDTAVALNKKKDNKSLIKRFEKLQWEHIFKDLLLIYLSPKREKEI